MNAKGIHVKTEGSVLIWWLTTPANARGSTWEGTASIVSIPLFFLFFYNADLLLFIILWFIHLFGDLMWVVSSTETC